MAVRRALPEFGRYGRTERDEARNTIGVTGLVSYRHALDQGGRSPESITVEIFGVCFELLDAEPVQLCVHHSERHTLRISAPCEHSDELADCSVSVCAGIGVIRRPKSQCAALLSNQLGGACAFVVGVDLIQRAERDLVADALGPQLAAECLFAFARVRVSRMHPLLGEGCIVDQLRSFETSKNGVGHLGREALLAQTRLEFVAATRTVGQQPKADILRLRFGATAFWNFSLIHSGLPTDQNSTGAALSSVAVTSAPICSFSMIFFSISSRISGFSSMNLRAFSLPCPS